MKKKMKKIRRLITTIEGPTKDTSKVLNETKTLSEKKSEPFFNIKKSKRRTKAMKAKITKIKNMELAERLSMKNNPELLNKLKGDSKLLEEEQQAFAPESNSLTSKIKLCNTKKYEGAAIIQDSVGALTKPENVSIFSTENTQISDSEHTLDYDIDDSVSIFDLQLAKEIQENEEMVRF